MVACNVALAVIFVVIPPAMLVQGISGQASSYRLDGYTLKVTLSAIVPLKLAF
jgi:hypothetical protein